MCRVDQTALPALLRARMSQRAVTADTARCAWNNALSERRRPAAGSDMRILESPGIGAPG